MSQQVEKEEQSRMSEAIQEEAPAPPPALPGEPLSFQVLYGAREGEPMSYILKVGVATILLDCGWDPGMDESIFTSLEETLRRVDLILISFPDLAHMGALPLVFKHMPKRPKVYCTLPVQKMGQMTLYDLFISKSRMGEPAGFTLDDVDTVCQSIEVLKYSQSADIRVKTRPYLSITPYPSGRMLGGSIWRIQWRKMEEIIYAVDFNFKRDRHLMGATEALNAIGSEKEKRPLVLITDAYSALTPPPDDKKVEVELIDFVTTTLRSGGNVLIPTETSGRVQEMLFLLNKHWSSDPFLGGYRIVLLHHTARNVLRFTRSMIEYMHRDLVRDFDKTLRNPFALRHVVAAHSMKDLEAAMGEYRNPVVVLASDESMEWGFARALAARWASEPANAVAFMTVNHKRGTLADSLWRLRHVPDASVTINLPVIEPIVGEELEQLREQEARDKRKATEMEEFRRQAQELLEGTVGSLLKDEGFLMTQDGDVGQGMKKRKRRSAAIYRRPRFLMFGCADPENLMDEYGLPLREGECVETSVRGVAAATMAMIARSKSQEAAGGAAAVARADERWGYLDGVLMTESEATEALGSPALKFVTKETRLEVKWQAKSFNLEARTDGKNLRAILGKLLPRNVVLVHGTEEAVNEVKRHAQSLANVATPAERGETVELRLDSQLLDITVADSWGGGGGSGLDEVQQSAKYLGGYGLSLVEAKLEPEGKSSTLSLQRTSHRSHPWLLCEGDILLTDGQLRQKLVEAGVTPEFTWGPEGTYLVCDKTTTVRVKDNRVVVEGELSETFFKVRKVLYSRFITL